MDWETVLLLDIGLKTDKRIEWHWFKMQDIYHVFQNVDPDQSLYGWLKWLLKLTIIRRICDIAFVL